MNTRELARSLEEEAANPANYGIGSDPGGYDGFSLLRENGWWRVYYVERGQPDDKPMFQSQNESEACEWFFHYQIGLRQDHLVGFFRSHGKAQDLVQRLEEHGLSPHSDSIPYGGPNDPRFRVFVVGKAIFPARELLGARLPLQD